MTSETQARSLFDPEILRPALLESVRKLDPRVQVRNPVMFVVEIGALIGRASCRERVCHNV